MQSFTSVLWLVLLPVLSLFILRQFVLAVMLDVSAGGLVEQFKDSCAAAVYRQLCLACLSVHLPHLARGSRAPSMIRDAPLMHARVVQEFSKLKRQAGNVPGIAADVASLLRERGQASFALAGQAALVAARACHFLAAPYVHFKRSPADLQGQLCASTFQWC